MKHNQWFEEKFLASLKNGQWLSEKQVHICKKYMTESRYYSGTWKLACGNTEYVMSVYKKGYGKLYIREYEFNLEERITDMYGNQYSAWKER